MRFLNSQKLRSHRYQRNVIIGAGIITGSILAVTGIRPNGRNSGSSTSTIKDWNFTGRVTEGALPGRNFRECMSNKPRAFEKGRLDAHRKRKIEGIFWSWVASEVLNII